MSPGNPINVSSSYVCTTSSPGMGQLGSNEVNLDPLRFIIIVILWFIFELTSTLVPWGDPPHADNVQFHSVSWLRTTTSHEFQLWDVGFLTRQVWWYGQQLRERDEIRAAQQGAYVHYEAKEVQALTWSNWTVFHKWWLQLKKKGSHIFWTFGNPDLLTQVVFFKGARWWTGD